MTKKDFIALADGMKKTRPDTYGDDRADVLALDQWKTDVLALADVLQADNGRFKRQLWLDYVNGVCGPNGGKIKS